jgi:dTDP-4-dehydrorhamnose reductase
MKPRVLLFGSAGQVGRDLAILLPQVSLVCALDRGQADLLQFEAVRASIRESKPKFVVNAAAYTAVDRAETEPQIAETINTDALGVIGEEAKKIGAIVIHYSTDYVFDGSKDSPYVEDDLPSPLNVYGRTKLDGEVALQESGAEYFILRTSSVYSTRGRNFLVAILKRATLHEELQVVRDQIGAPTWSRMIAAATTNVIQKLAIEASRDLSEHYPSGIYHMTAAGQTSWHGFAEAILEEYSSFPEALPWLNDATQGKELVAKRVQAISSSEYPALARRPINSVLANDKFCRVFGFRLPDWREQLNLAVRDAQLDLTMNEVRGLREQCTQIRGSRRSRPPKGMAFCRVNSQFGALTARNPILLIPACICYAPLGRSPLPGGCRDANQLPRRRCLRSSLLAARRPLVRSPL